MSDILLCFNNEYYYTTLQRQMQVKLYNSN